MIFSKEKIKQSAFQFEKINILNVYIYSTFTEAGVSGNLAREVKVAGGTTEDVIQPLQTGKSGLFFYRAGWHCES